MKPNENMLTKFEILRALSYVPDERLQEIDNFIKFILYQSKIETGRRKKEPATLAGIWKDKGFDKIPDLDKEIKKLLGTPVISSDQEFKAVKDIEVVW